MSTNGNLLTSPVGEILYMAVAQPVTNAKTGKARKEITLLLDSKEAAEFISAVADVNSGIPVTEHTYRPQKKTEASEKLKAALKGKTKISAGTQYDVAVFDSQGNEIEDIPSFFAGESKGTAQMVVQPYTKSDKGGSINLVAVYIHSLEGSKSTTSREERLAQLRAMAKENAKNL